MVLMKLYIFRATFTRTPLGDFLSIKMFIGNILYIYIIYDIIYEIIYKKAYNSSFHQNLEKIQYISPLAITGAIRGTSKENLCQGLESLEKKRLYRKLCYLNKIFKKQYPTYLLNGIPVSSRSYFTRNVENVHSFKVRQDFLKIPFFLLQIYKKIFENQKVLISLKKAF